MLVHGATHGLFVGGSLNRRAIDSRPAAQGIIRERRPQGCGGVSHSQDILRTLIRKFLAPVTSNTPLAAPGHYVMTFHAPELAAEARPGSFVAISALGAVQILRRPFSVFSADPETGEASILYNAVGQTSSFLAARQPGDYLDMLGPLGGHLFQADPRPGTRHIMVGGGYGVPPLVFLAKTIRDAAPDAEMIFINGARTRDFLVGTESVESLGAQLLLTTDDGSHGLQGRVTAALEPLLAARKVTHVYTCGPTPMMRAVAEMSIAAGVPCQVSLEVFMPCGMGICMGCAVKRPDGTYARGCFEGPVFEAWEVVWE